MKGCLLMCRDWQHGRCLPVGAVAGLLVAASVLAPATTAVPGRGLTAAQSRSAPRAATAMRATLHAVARPHVAVVPARTPRRLPLTVILFPTRASGALLVVGIRSAQ